ncbi:MAG: hypothetical protein A2252_09275 [Elusimicrobia bacterium RIFOXYA2_FULL_39_19]|nr:MAG: hypothetical protein A2252_09275 [Elusimicrobia bacterium RIFOXYA2_FULL_39_19]
MERRLLSLKEAAYMLDIKTGTLYNWVWQRKITFVKQGSLVKFDVKDLEKWIEKNKVDITKYEV